jgi:TRAP-type C4-dicarboxylate transport system permease small subunit
MLPVSETHSQPSGRFDRWSRVYMRVTRQALEALGILALGLMVLVNGAEIGFRAFASQSLHWVHELSIALAMFIYFALYATIAKDRSYIRLEVFEAGGTALARPAAIIGGVLVIVFQLLLFSLAWHAAKFAWLFETPILHLPESVYLIPLVIGCGDIVVSEIIHLVRILLGRPEEEKVRAGILT